MRLLVLLCCFGVGARAQPDNEKQSIDLVEAYIDPAATQEKRAEALVALCGSNAKWYAKAIEYAMRTEAKRDLAIELAVALRPPKFHLALNDYLKWNEDKIIRAIAAVGDRPALDYLAERWTSKPTTDPAFAIASKALQQIYTDAKVVQKLYGCVDSADRGPDALLAIKFQLGLGCATVQELKDQWKEVSAKLELQAKVPVVKGQNLLPSIPWELQKATRVLAGLRVEPEGFMQTRAAPLVFRRLDRYFEVLVHVYCEPGVLSSEAVVAVSGATVGCSAILSNGNWVVKTKDGAETGVPARTGWNELSFRYADEQAKRVVHFSANGQALPRPMLVTEAVTMLQVRGGKNGILVGGFFCMPR